MKTGRKIFKYVMDKPLCKFDVPTHSEFLTVLADKTGNQPELFFEAPFEEKTEPLYFITYYNGDEIELKDHRRPKYLGSIRNSNNITMHIYRQYRD